MTSITYELLYVGETNGRIGIESYVFDYASFQQLATELVPSSSLRANEGAGRAPQSMFSALSAHGGSRRR